MSGFDFNTDFYQSTYSVDGQNQGEYGNGNAEEQHNMYVLNLFNAEFVFVMAEYQNALFLHKTGVLCSQAVRSVRLFSADGLLGASDGATPAAIHRADLSTHTCVYSCLLAVHVWQHL